MKKICVLLIAAMVSTTAFCQDNMVTIPQTVSAAFTAKYPLIKKANWYDDGDAYAARFYVRGEPCTARFNEKGEWLDETKKLSFGELRNNVRNAFSQSKFASWQAHEVNEIQERNKDIRYRIFIRNGEDKSEKYIDYDAKGQIRKQVSM